MLRKVLLVVSLFFAFNSCKNLNEGSYHEENEKKQEKAYVSTLEDKGDYYLYEGDIIFQKKNPKTSEIINYLKGQNNDSRGLKMTYTKLWTQWGKGVVRYAFIGNISEDDKSKIRCSMRILESICDVKYVDYTGKTSNYDYIYRIKLNTTSDIGWSDLGQTSMPITSLATTDTRHVLHEFMHGLGIHHEHQRWDRNKYVDYNEENLDGTLHKGHFTHQDKEKCITYGNYDYKSIMHYKQNAGGQDVLVAKNGTTIGGDYLSTQDKKTLRALYGEPREKNYVFTGNFINAGIDGTKDEIAIKSGHILEIRNSDFKFVKTTGSQLCNYSNRHEKTWKLDLKKDKFKVGDFDGNGRDDFLVTSDWGIGVLTAYGDWDLRTIVFAKNKTWFGSWCFNSINDEILGIDNFDGEPGDEILIRSSWGIGLLKYDNGTFRSIVCKPNGTWLGGWKYWKSDKIVSVGEFNRDNKVDFIIESNWGMGIITYNGNGSFKSLVTRQFGSWMQDWKYEKGDMIVAVGNFDGHGAEEFIITKDSYIGILKYNNGSIASLMKRHVRELHSPLNRNSLIAGDYMYFNEYPKRDRIEIKLVGDLLNDGRDYILLNYLDKVGNSIELDEDYLFKFDGNTLKFIRKGVINPIISNYDWAFKVLEPIDMNGNGAKSILVYDPYSTLQIHSMKWKYGKLFCTKDYY